MKKTIRTVAFLLGLVVLSLAVASCGESSSGDPSDENGPMDFYGIDTSAYVTLGQYKGITVEVNKTTVSDEDVEAKIKIYLEEEDLFEKILEGVIEENVIFSIDFEGYCDGIQFQGGTAADQIVYIKGGEFCTADGGKFIDGFVEATLGASVGDRVEANVTFPESYHNAELAGKDAIFYVTINYILLPDREGIREELEDELKMSWLVDIFGVIVENATFIELPERQVNYYYEYYKECLIYYGQMEQLTYEEALSSGFAEYIFGISAKTDEELREVAEQIVKEELATFAFINAEGITVSDEEYEEFMAELVDAGYSREQIEAIYSKSYICREIALSKAYERVIEINTFVEKK